MIFFGVMIKRIPILINITKLLSLATLYILSKIIN